MPALTAYTARLASHYALRGTPSIETGGALASSSLSAKISRCRLIIGSECARTARLRGFPTNGPQKTFPTWLTSSQYSRTHWTTTTPVLSPWGGGAHGCARCSRGRAVPLHGPLLLQAVRETGDWGLQAEVQRFRATANTASWTAPATWSSSKLNSVGLPGMSRVL